MGHGRREETRKQEATRILLGLFDDLRLLASGPAFNLDEVAEILELIDEEGFEAVEAPHPLVDEVRDGTLGWEAFSDQVRDAVDGQADLG